MALAHQLELVFPRGPGADGASPLGGCPRLIRGGVVAEGRRDAARACWAWDGLRPGRYRLELGVRGWRPERYTVRVHFGRTRQVIPLRPRVRGGGLWERYIAIFPSAAAYDTRTGRLDPRLLSLLDRSGFIVDLDVHGGSAGGYETLGGPVTGAIPVLPGGVLVLPWAGEGLTEERAAPLRALNEHPLIRAAGRVRAFSSSGLVAELESGRVAFRPGISDAEARAALRRGGLRAVGRVLLGSGIYRVRALDLDRGIGPLLDGMARGDQVRYAEAERARVLGADAMWASDFLWPSQWEKRIAGVDRAWARLAGAGRPAHGDPELLAGVIDGGVRSYGGEVDHPDLSGFVSNGEPKIAALYDFRLYYRRADHDIEVSPHGTQVAAALAARAGSGEGGRGAAPGIRLCSSICNLSEDYELIAAFLWTAGLGDRIQPLLRAWFASELPAYVANLSSFEPLPVLGEPVDVLVSAQAFGQGGIGALGEELLSLLSRRTRSGRGAGFFFSAGNGDEEIATARGFANHERSFACGASTLDAQCVERRAAYSGHGAMLDWCAPSSSEESATWDPPARWSIWVATELDRGEVVSHPLRVSALGAAAAPGDGELVLVEPIDYFPGTRLLLGTPEWPGEWARIRYVTAGGRVALERPLLRDHPQGEALSSGGVSAALAAAAAAGDTAVEVGAGTGLVQGAWIRLGPADPTGEQVVVGALAGASSGGTAPIDGLASDWPAGTKVACGVDAVTTLTADTGTSAQVLYVADTADIAVGDHLRIEDRYSPGLASYITVAEVLGPDSIRILDSEWVSGRYSGDRLYRTGLHAVDDFGGTSAAAPLAAGIGALVLTAQPRLTWVELRQILRDTAAKIDVTPDRQWYDGQGAPTTDPGAAVFSKYLGYGRLDADRAVAAALRYEADRARDLYLRNTPGDDGAAATATADSPDIWVRNTDPAADADWQIDEAPSATGDSWIYLRVRNRGQLDSLDAWARVYIAARRAGGGDYRWPEDFDNSRVGLLGPGKWERGVYFLDEVKLSAVPAGGELVVYLEWPAAMKPPALCTDGQPFDPRILAELNPFDGPLDGNTVLDNNNLSRRIPLRA